MNLLKLGVSPEDQALLLVARCRRDPAARTALGRLLEAGLDWKRLSEVARGHGMLVILAKMLIDYLPGSIPPDRPAECARLYRANTMNSTHRVAELVMILDRLRQNGIDSLPLKGPVLAETVYGDAALRVSCDHDLLLAPEDVKAAATLLAEWDYRPTLRLDARQWTTLFRFENELILPAVNGQTMVELHWEVLPRRIGCGLDLRRLATRSRPVRVLGHMMPWPRPDDLFLLLCLHGTKHRWEQLEHVYAVAEVVEANPGLDWMGLLRAATDLGVRRRCLLGGLLAADLLDAPLPPAFLHQARADLTVVGLTRRALAGLFRADHDRIPTLRERLSWDIRSLDTSRAQLRCLLMRTLAPTAEDWKELALPTSLHALYYPARPMRLVIKYGRRTAHRVTRALGRRTKRPPSGV